MASFCKWTSQADILWSYWLDGQCYWPVFRPDKLWYLTCARMESLLVKTLNSHFNSTELQFMEKVYSDDVDIEMLTTKMEILKVLLKDGDFLCLDDVIVKFKELLAPERKMINKVITVCKLILVNPATSAAGERSLFDFLEIKNMASFNNDPRTIMQSDDFKQSQRKNGQTFSSWHCKRIYRSQK